MTLGIFGLIAGLLQKIVISDNSGTFLVVMSLIVAIALTLLAGARASQRTGRVGTGALAGLIVGLISSLFGSIKILTTIFIFDTPLHRWLSQATPGQAQQLITHQFVVFVIIELIIGFVVIPLLEAVIGAIGGLIVRRRTQLPMQA